MSPVLVVNKLIQHAFVVLLSVVPLYGQFGIAQRVRKPGIPTFKVLNPVKDSTKPFYRIRKPFQPGWIREAIAIGPEKSRILLKRAGYYLSAGVESSFRRDVGRSLELEPDNERIIIEATRLLMERADLEKCMWVVDVTTSYISRHSNSDPAYYARSLGRTCTGDLERAFNDALAASKINPTNLQYRYAQWDIVRDFGLTKQAIEHYQILIDEYERRLRQDQDRPYRNYEESFLASTYQELSRAYREMGRKDDDLAAQTRSVELLPEYYLRFRAAAYRHYQMYDEAIADLNRAIAMQPKFIRRDDQASLYWVRADVYFVMGRFDEAIADYEKYMALQPQSNTFIEPKIRVAEQKRLEIHDRR